MVQKDVSVKHSEFSRMYSIIYSYVYMLSSLSVFEAHIPKKWFFEQLVFRVYFYM